MLKITVILFFFFASCRGVTDNESGYVQNGHEAILGQFPWQAAVHVKNNYRCLGVLIDKTHVLTTNKCLTDKDMDGGTVTVHFGVLKAAETTHVRKALSIIRDTTADLAVLLIEEILASSTVRGIRVTHKVEIMNFTFATSSGWGFNNTYIHSNLQFVDLEVAHYNEGIFSSNNAQHACIWDQGTGLVAIDDVTLSPTLIGIAKHNKEPCNGDDSPSVYISTFQNKEFINSALQP